MLLNKQVLYESALHLGSFLLYCILLMKASNPELFSDRVVRFYVSIIRFKSLKKLPQT